jgi:DNA (cytosine-5)-methyltransferase 1
MLPFTMPVRLQVVEGKHRLMPTVVDLFCGAGGLSYGFEMAGFDVVAALDFDPVAAETYRRQNPTVPLIVDDIANVTGKQLKHIAQTNVDVVIGGPSCQGFSTHGKRDPNDPRNLLFQHFVRIVDELRPTWVVMENVRGLLTYDRGRYRNEIHAALQKIGYVIDSKVLRAVDFGVPQMRERLFFIASRVSTHVDFPAPTHCPPDVAALTGLKPYVTVHDAIADLPLIGEEGDAGRYDTRALTEFQRYARRRTRNKLTLHRARRVSDLAMSIISRVPQGAGLRALPPDQLPERFRRMRTISTGQLRRDCTTLYHRLSWDKPAYTITCYFTNVSSGPFVHPAENRALTPREAARLQSFPDDYKFSGKQLQRQIGNAVPPLLGFAVARSLRRQMEARASRDAAIAI